jgi:hypothetical protein
LASAGAGGFGGGGGGGFTGGAGQYAGAAGSNGNIPANPGTATFLGGSAGKISGSTGAPGGHGGGTGGFGGGGGGGGPSVTSGVMPITGTPSNGGGGGGGGWIGGNGGTNGGGGGGGSYFDGTPTTNAGGGANPGEGQVTITFVAFCFASGSRIATERGEVAVEDLAIGDLAVTSTGAARSIRWLGHRRIDRPTAEQMPVRVMAGAFGDSLPARDLYLSPGHAVCVSVMNEVFVPVGELINGATIAQVEVPEITYWHVELESHDVLLAEGLPCESYMDAGNRDWFGRAYGRLDEVDPARIAASLSRYARPFVNKGPVVEAIRARLTARAAAAVAARAAA